MIKKLAIVSFSFVLGLALSVVPAHANQGVDHTKKIVNLAGYDSLTGKFGDYGTTDEHGQEIAVAEINAHGGILSGPLKGYKLKLTFFDDQGNPQEAANAAKAICAGDYLVALGPTISSDALAATPVFYRNAVPNIITYSNAGSITAQGFNNLLRLTFTTGDIAKYMANEVQNKFKKNSVALISDNQSYGQQLVAGFDTRAKQLGIKILSHSITTPGQNVFNAMLMKAKMQNPGMMVLMETSYSAAGLLVKQAREIGYKGPIYVPDAETQPKFFALAGDLKNTFIEIPPSISIKRPAVKRLKAEWDQKYTGFPPISAVYGYDAVKIAVAVIEKGGITHKSFIDKMKSVKVKGVANSLYTFAKNGDTSSLPAFVTKPCEQYYKSHIQK